MDAGRTGAYYSLRSGWILGHGRPKIQTVRNGALTFLLMMFGGMGSLFRPRIKGRGGDYVINIQKQTESFNGGENVVFDISSGDGVICIGWVGDKSIYIFSDISIRTITKLNNYADYDCATFSSETKAGVPRSQWTAINRTKKSSWLTP